jgi:HK97 gp10 family phage protein
MPKQALSIDLKGVKELEIALEALGKDVATRIGRKAVRDPAKVLQEALVLSAPYRPGTREKSNGRYGHLRDNLKVVSVRAKKPGLLLYRVSTGDAFWGNFLERGTVTITPRPWMRPTVDRETDNIVSLQIETLTLGIDRAAKRLARKAAKYGAVMPNGRNR